MSAKIVGVLGIADSFCIEASGGIEAAYFTLSSKVNANTDGEVWLTPKLKVGALIATFSLQAKVDVGTFEERYELIFEDYMI